VREGVGDDDRLADALQERNQRRDAHHLAPNKMQLKLLLRTYVCMYVGSKTL
jgi:hypothetical protein